MILKRKEKKNLNFYDCRQSLDERQDNFNYIEYHKRNVRIRKWDLDQALSLL